MTKYVVKPFFK